MEKKLSPFFVLLAVIYGLGFSPAIAVSAEPTDILTAEINGGSYVMERVVTASGEKYEVKGDPSISFWSKGADAIFRVKGITVPRYVLMRETINTDELLLTADGKNYLLKREAASGAKYASPEDPETYLWCKDDEALLVIEGKDYGEYDEKTPVIGEIWIAKLKIPTETEWQVVSIGGEKLLGGSSVTMKFTKDGRVAGFASVNNFSASWIESGNKLMLTGAISTRKAGPEALMSQEDKFLKLLENINSFVVRDDVLTLITRDRTEIVLVK